MKKFLDLSLSDEDVVFIMLINVKILFYFICFVALRPKSTGMVIAGRSVHLTTLFPGQA